MESTNQIVMPQIEKILSDLEGGKTIETLLKKAKKKAEKEKNRQG